MNKSYRENYLISNHWKETKNKFRQSKLYKGKCSICYRLVKIDIHHLTYKRISKEYLSDLMAVCRECHNLIHNLPINQSIREKTKRIKKRIKKWIRRTYWDKGRKCPQYYELPNLSSG